MHLEPLIRSCGSFANLFVLENECHAASTLCLVGNGKSQEDILDLLTSQGYCSTFRVFYLSLGAVKI